MPKIRIKSSRRASDPLAAEPMAKRRAFQHHSTPDAVDDAIPPLPSYAGPSQPRHSHKQVSQSKAKQEGPSTATSPARINRTSADRHAAPIKRELNIDPAERTAATEGEASCVEDSEDIKSEENDSGEDSDCSESLSDDQGFDDFFINLPAFSIYGYLCEFHPDDLAWALPRDGPECPQCLEQSNIRVIPRRGCPANLAGRVFYKCNNPRCSTMIVMWADAVGWDPENPVCACRNPCRELARIGDDVVYECVDKWCYGYVLEAHGTWRIGGTAERGGSSDDD